VTAARVQFVVPGGVDDPDRVSGGNVYDRHVRDGLRRRGWRVDVSETADAASAASVFRSVADDALVLVDGLVAGWAPEQVAATAGRARLVVLAHMVAAGFPDATPAVIAAERRVLGAARRVVVTSRWSADELVGRDLAERDRITVAAPGVRVGGGDAAARAAHTMPGGHAWARPAATREGAPRERRLLCVGVVAPHKGQDTLLDALARLAETDWTCTIVGSARSFPEFASSIAARAASFAGRVTLAGVLDGARLDDAYRRSALLVAPSRVESAGMAIADARARGLPVVASTAGGIPDTVAGGGALLVRPGDAPALAGALTSWMTDPALRARLRRETRRVRTALPTWDDTVTTIAAALEAT